MMFDVRWPDGTEVSYYSPSLVVTDAYVDREARKGAGPSDHAPVVVDLTA